MSKVSLKRASGFTLVEMLIVMVIIGLLASLVAPDLMKNIGKSKHGTAQAQMQLLETALDTYYLDVGEYPKELNALRSSSQSGWNGPYLKKAIPLDPWGRAYILQTPGPDGTPYLLQSLGKDGQIGGDGEDLDIEVGR